MTSVALETPENDAPDLSSIRQIIDHHASSQPDDIALIDPLSGADITYRELQTSVQAVAQAIVLRGVRPGEAVAYAASNSPQTAIVVLGIAYGGFLATAINLVAGNSIISYVLEHCEAKLIFANDAGLMALEEPLQTAGDLPLMEISNDLFLLSDVYAADASTAELGGLLMYTSGTTGRPKGVVLSQSNLIAGGANTALAHQLSSRDRGLCVLPLYHINGLCVTVMGALVSGSGLVLPPKFSVSTFWSTVIEQGCTWFSVVPTQISYLLHDESKEIHPSLLQRVRFGRSASAPLSPDVQSAFEKKFGIPIIETMGLTETAAQILSNPLPPGTRKIGSPGIAFGNEVMIADSEQREVARGTEGEVLVRGPNVMKLYLKNEEATREAITEKGWLRTGDLGRMDEDDYVFITGRLKELIIKGGENIAPREVDEALYSHTDVIEAAAFACRCERYGERIEAAVKLSSVSQLSEADLIELCRNKLGKFKTPDRIYVLDELPKGPSGKIQRIKLAEIFDLA
ncbi:AMP-binding protein [Pseudahrensia aquimaris]|uniref:AMP-binding protein n=1 Tax=Pseudahrensia aquimaris TaxID=744461 RepID=A0ABW3FC39_9HYPH